METPLGRSLAMRERSSTVKSLFSSKSKTGAKGGSPIGFRGIRTAPEWNAERHGNPLNVDEANIALTPFDAADVGAVEIAGQSEAFLRQAPFGAQLAHALTEGHLDRFVSALSQAPMGSLVMTLSLRTLSIINLAV